MALEDWLCNAVETQECFVLGQPEIMSGLIVGNCEFIEESGRTKAPGLELCKELGYNPQWIFLTPWGADIMAGAYSDDVPQTELLLIAKGHTIGTAILKIKNYII
jgi:hypothetical protein